MKVLSVQKRKSNTPIGVLDSYVDKGYLQGESGSLPDVDVDYQSDKRQDVKAYIERRYNHDGKQRVFSAGTTTTLKAKAVIKDVARTMRIPVATVNYITAMLDDDKVDYTGIFKLAATNKKIAKFISDYPQLFEDIRTLMFQPRSASIHASALLVTPDDMDGEDMECFDFVPIKKVDGILVSDNDGYELDELGLLKNDCLATKELSKLHETIDLCNKEYSAGLTFENMCTGDLNDERVFQVLSEGYTQNVFQFSSAGITKFLTQLKPTCIDDLIAANALYRPATMGNLDDYVNCKNGLVQPVYLWGTYNSLKDTYAQVIFQEQIVMMAREIGGFSLGDGVKLVKFVSKKKTDKIKAMKEKFMAGAKKNGCPQEDADKIWAQIEAAGTYCFNKCISGKEYICDENGQAQCNIETMYLQHKRGIGLSLDEEKQVLCENKIVDIRYMGVRKLYRIKLRNGKMIDVTDNHKHPTNNGIKRTDELVVGRDRMYCQQYLHDTKHVTSSIVESIDYIGEDSVYDVEMADPHHSFVTGNGVITCNSHATAYAVTAYAGAWLKVHYPTAFYTVALQWADDDELTTLMSEMEAISNAKVVSPDINSSGAVFYTNYETNEIFWSLSRIKMLGVKAVEWIVNEREKHGKFTGIDNFIDRIFKYKLKKYEYWDDPDNEEEVQRCPVNARHVLNLILAGCFDKVEHAESVIERYAIIEKAANKLGFQIQDKDIPADMRDKHYFWSQKQVAISGIGAIDYKRIYDNSTIKPRLKGRVSYATIKGIMDDSMEEKRVGMCATIVELEEKRFTSKKTGNDETFCKLMLQQNTDFCECLIWPDEYGEMRGQLLEAKNHPMVFSGVVKFSDYIGKNQVQFYKNTLIEIL